MTLKPTVIPLGLGMCQTEPLFSGTTSFMCFNRHSFGPSNLSTDSCRGDSLAHVLFLSDHGTVSLRLTSGFTRPTFIHGNTQQREATTATYEPPPTRKLC